ncbi:MAG: hypothetical protein ABI432_15775 [Flavobacteriales bacterium]
MALTDTLKLSCHKATALIERRELRPLGPAERLGLWMHLRICDHCRAFEKQSRVIETLLLRRSVVNVDSSALEARILTRIG